MRGFPVLSYFLWFHHFFSSCEACLMNIPNGTFNFCAQIVRSQLRQIEVSTTIHE